MEGTSQFKSCILFTQNENENNTDSVPPQEIIRLQDSIREINTAHGLAANCHILPSHQCLLSYVSTFAALESHHLLK